MRYILVLILIVLFTSCNTEKTNLKSIIFSGDTPKETEYIVLSSDTLEVNNGAFKDTLTIKESLYDYVQLSNWKWPKLVYLDGSKSLNVDFSEPIIKIPDDILNSYLLNSDSILNPYSLRWDMDEEIFRNTITKELDSNFHIIDSVFINSGIRKEFIKELKTIEKLKVAHRTANFIGFQERKGNLIDRDIYDFVAGVNLNNKRLEKQKNNRNFQYYYLLDKVNEEVPDSIYPFAVIDTVNKYSTINSIRKMIITSTVKSSFYNEEVNHDKLLSIYEDNFGVLEEDYELLILIEKIRKLKPGNKAPSFGELKNINEGFTTISELKGKNVLLTVWGTWCPHCKEELPTLKELINKYPDKFISVGISFDKDIDEWKTFVRESAWGGVHLIDAERKSEFKSNYLVNGTNVYMLIDKEGFIVSSKTLKPSSEELEKLIIELP